MKIPRLLFVLATVASLSACYGPVTSETRVRGVPAANSVLVLPTSYRSKRVELPAGYYEYMPDFSNARAISYLSPAPIRKKALVPFLWTTHRFGWISVPPDGAPGNRSPRWVVWEHGDNDKLGDDFIYVIRPVVPR